MDITKKKKEKIILAVDTVSENSSVAVGSSDLLWQGERRQSSELLKKIENLMKENMIDFSGLDGIGVIIGPGSYTGIRIGVSVANTVAQFCKIPIKTMDTLCAQALILVDSIVWKEKQKKDKKEIVSLISAGFGRVYARKYLFYDSMLDPVVDFFHGEAIDFLKQEDKNIFIVGEINEELKKILDDGGFGKIFLYERGVEKSRSRILVENFRGLSAEKKNLALPKYL
ncbi:MAG: tRNA (adenosine(37)-N6)-threonylcarbamoyltransferase complex dimerization subunit type 1 TsaB [Patescibacteria group bacterium]